MRRRLVIMAAFCLLQSCSGNGAVTRVVASWFDAVHAADFPRLALVDASAPDGSVGPEFDAWKSSVSSVMARYERDRDGGRIEIDERGYLIPLVTRVGRGTYWQVESVARAGRLETASLTLNFGYGEIAYGQLQRGTTVYLLTRPLGSIRAITLGRGEEHRMDVIEHLRLDVELSRPLAGGARRVVRVRWDPESAEYGSVAWVF